MDWRPYAKRLSEMKGFSGIPRGRLLSWEEQHCFMGPSRLASEMILGAQTLVVGPQACLAAILRTGRSMSRKVVNVGARLHPEVNFHTFVIDKEGAAIGDDDKLVVAIREIVDKQKPPVLVITQPCMNEVIGLDLESVVKSLGDMSPTRVVYLKVDVFSGRDRTIPQDQYTAQFIRMMDAPAIKDDRRVNIFCGRWGFRRNTWEIDDLLKSAGFNRVVVFPSQSCTMEDLRTAPEAGFTIIMDDIFSTLGNLMRERFGCRVWHHQRPIGLDATRSWYERLSKAMGVKLDYTSLLHRVESRIAELKPRLEGKTFCLKTIWGPGQTSMFLLDLGMTPKVLVYDDDPRGFERPHLKHLLDRGIDPWVCRPNHLVLKGLLRDEHPDFMSGCAELEYELGIPDIPLKGTSISGFEASEYAMETIAKHFDGSRGDMTAKEEKCVHTT